MYFLRGLYQDDPYLLQFRSKVTGSIAEEEKTGILIENTVFYPEGGGQPSDQGNLVCARRSYEVLHVEERNGQIIHWIAGTAMPSLGTEVLMTVDAERRRDHMQQHHGQHIISAIFEQQYGFETIGFHLGQETCTIDLKTSNLSPELLKEAEIEANNIVMENLPVKTEYYRRDQLAPELMAKLPSEQTEVRLVIIPGIDENACCGTHPRYTGEVGPIKLLKTEKVRTHVRLHFICGLRAVIWMQGTANLLKDLEDAVGAAGSEAVTRINKREQEIKQFQRERKELLKFKYQAIAGELRNKAQRINDVTLIIQHIDDADMDMLRGLACSLNLENQVTILAGGQGPFNVVFACGQSTPVPASKLAEHIWPLLKGKGGGSSGFVQGAAQELPLDRLTEEVIHLIKNS
ncbi:alanyl-tRNA editing protein [Desulforamulus aquiferis]|uniref:Alanyl-tRNA editing protein n=1 Tax=Desulforamulus aquiferis TaxID=1397668 RepID=A0AAW7ZHG9_9FIRM|nr:alanyl-tRNA editing protein [Desulforamulus aquiferis]MDO7788466.1 alanyl-tRNA editing protein [Desulforamulus aquiferis]RYD05646.1 hypothetical protein N752_07055 [Desulforamulus aquiferis]